MKAFESFSHCVDTRSPVYSSKDGGIPLVLSHPTPNPTERTESQSKVKVGLSIDGIGLVGVMSSRSWWLQHGVCALTNHVHLVWHDYTTNKADSKLLANFHSLRVKQSQSLNHSIIVAHSQCQYILYQVVHPSLATQPGAARVCKHVYCTQVQHQPLPLHTHTPTHTNTSHAHSVGI